MSKVNPNSAPGQADYQDEEDYEEEEPQAAASSAAPSPIPFSRKPQPAATARPQAAVTARPADPQATARRSAASAAVQPADPQATTAGPQVQPADLGLSEAALQAMLEANFPKQRWFDEPPDLSRAKVWAGWVGEIVAAPFNWFLDAGSNPDVPVEDSEYQGWFRTNLYRVGGGLAFLFSAYISQAVTAHVFPEAGKASSLTATNRGGFFNEGWFNLDGRAIIASLVFVSMLSVIETMLFDKNKSRGKRLIISVAFLVDVVINVIGWADFWGHSRRFEWLPWGFGRDIEFGSILCIFSGILNAVMPELMWEKARRSRRAARLYKLQLKAARAAARNSKGKERGVWVDTPQGKKWLTESQLRAMQSQVRAGGRR